MFYTFYTFFYDFFCRPPIVPTSLENSELKCLMLRGLKQHFSGKRAYEDGILVEHLNE